MSDISQVQLPSGVIYDIKDEIARQMTLNVTYTSATQDLEIEFTTATNADNQEY